MNSKWPVPVVCAGLVVIAALVAVIIGLVITKRPPASNQLVSVTLKGGIGNQLFQMAMAYGFARRHGRKHVIHSSMVEHNPHSNTDYNNTIFRRWEKSNQEIDAKHIAKESDCFIFEDIAPTSAHHVHFIGYFQQEQYLGNYAEAFIASLDLPTHVSFLPNSCFVHMRFGDYHNSQLHSIDLSVAYLQSAMQLVRQKRPGVQFVVFSDDMEKSKRLPNLMHADVSFQDESDELRTLVAMSRCHVGGICSNSSFSWWGAYLNRNERKVVVFPRKWLNNDWPCHVHFRGAHVLDV